MLTGLTIKGLSITRGERRLFQGLEVRLQAGQALALTGANGAGKTSLLRAVAGFIQPDSGVVSFTDLHGERDAEVARREDLHLLGHLGGLKPQRTARQELRFQTSYLGGTPEAAESAVARLRLEPLLDLETRRLSAGQRRRLSFARLLGAPRSLWLLDEPLAPLDEIWRAEMAGLIKDHLQGGGMIIAAVHDPLPLEALSLDLGDLA